jgi:hypothetical protein
MPMTSEQVKAIQDSFAKVAPISEQAAEIFYGRLFEIAPAVKPLFRGDMKEQGKTVVINGLAGGKRARQTPRRVRRQGNRLCSGRRGVVVDA